MTRLSVNINKIALIRNSRGANKPDLVQVARDCESFGAEGITVHPRPDQRHIRYDDIPQLKEVVTTEFNIEGYPSPAFMDLVLKNKPHQVTLVPDLPGALTSDNGWDTIKHQSWLEEIVAEFKSVGIRTSLFLNPEAHLVEGAARTGTDRIEFYTGPYAHQYHTDPVSAVKSYKEAARVCVQVGLGVNAGHDLDLKNLTYFNQNLPNLLEVSIGHALVCDALYYGLQNVIQMYLSRLAEK